MRPVIAILTIFTASGAGWYAGTLQPVPDEGAASGSRPRAGQSRPDQKAVVADTSRAREAAAEYVRIAEIRAREPRDFGAEWLANLDRKKLIPEWAAADPDGFFAWFLQYGWRQWGNYRDEFSAVLDGKGERLFLCIPRLDWRDRGEFADIATDLALRLPAEQAASLFSRFAGVIGNPGAASVITYRDAFALLDAVSRKMPAGRGRDGLLTFLAGRGAFTDPQSSGRWWRSQDEHTKAITAVSVIEGGYREDGPPPWNESTFSDMVSYLGRMDVAGGTALSKWMRYLAVSDPTAAARQAVASVRPLSVHYALKEAWSDLLNRATSPDDVAPVLEVLSLGQIRCLISQGFPPTLLHNVVLPLLQTGSGKGYQFAVEAARGFSDQPEVADLIRECREPLPADLIDRVAVNLPGGYRDKLAWIQSLEGQPVREALANLAGAWFDKDPAGAAAALGGLPAGTLRHAAIQKASVWLGQEPAAAREWLATLPASDRPAVVIAVQDSGLDSSVKQEILTPPGDPSPGAEK